MKSSVKICAVGVLLVFLTACQTSTKPPVDTPQPKALTSQDWLERLQTRNREFRNLRSFVKTTIVTAKGSQTLRQVLLVKGQRTFRLDTLSVFGQPLGVLIVAPGKTQLYDPRQQKTYTGQEVWEMMYRNLGTVFDFREYIHIFSGNVPGVETWDGDGLKPLPKEAGWEVPLENGRDRLWVSVDPFTGLPVRMQKWNQGRPVYQVQWEDYRESEGTLFPHTISVHRPLLGDTVTLKFSDPKINQGIPKDAFNLQLS